MATLIALLMGMVWAMNWLEKRDQQLMRWAGSYEECVKHAYNTTPTAYYWENGEYPECTVQIEITIERL